MSTSKHPMAKNAHTVICTFRVKAGKEREFEGLLAKHWPTLEQRGLVAKTPTQIFRGVDDGGGVFFVEIFTWKDGKASDLAHQDPEVMKIWEPMGGLIEDRDGRPGMEFPHVEPLAFPGTR